MSISELNNNESVFIEPKALENEISDLDQNIQTLIQKINKANKELIEIDKKLSKIDPSTGIIGGFKYFFSSTADKQNINELKIQKAALESFRESNHEALSYCEQQIKHYEKAAEKNQSSNSILMPYCEETFADKGTLLIQAPTMIDHGISAAYLAPIGLGGDPILMKLTKKAQGIFQKAISCRMIKDLYIEAMLTPHPKTGETGPWKFFLLDNDNIPESTKKHGGSCGHENRWILIDGQRSDEEILSIFVFELTNAIASEKFHALDQAAKKGKISREDYAKRKEFIEHQGMLRHETIMRHAAKEMRWNVPSSVFMDGEKDFGRYWEQIKDRAHTESYRKQWDRFQGSMKAG